MQVILVPKSQLFTSYAKKWQHKMKKLLFNQHCKEQPDDDDL